MRIGCCRAALRISRRWAELARSRGDPGWHAQRPQGARRARVGPRSWAGSLRPRTSAGRGAMPDRPVDLVISGRIATLATGTGFDWVEAIAIHGGRDRRGRLARPTSHAVGHERPRPSGDCRRSSWSSHRSPMPISTSKPRLWPRRQPDLTGCTRGGRPRCHLRSAPGDARSMGTPMAGCWAMAGRSTRSPGTPTRTGSTKQHRVGRSRCGPTTTIRAGSAARPFGAPAWRGGATPRWSHRTRRRRPADRHPV